jgi:hypothetical protein
MQIILAAILFLSPHLGRDEAIKYAETIYSLSEVREIDPFLVISIIRVESNFKHDARSRTRDYGPMQIHVSRTTHRDLRGHEWLLFNPVLNIYLGTKHLQMFKKWHDRKCGPDHLWWRHYKWGFRKNMPNDKWARKVERYRQQLIKRFNPGPGGSVENKTVTHGKCRRRVL